MAANDGQDLAGQPPSVQQLFNSTYGANAGSVWDQQHNAVIGGGSASNYPAATVPSLNMPDYASLFAGIGNGTSAMTAATQRQAALLGFTPQPGKDRLSRSLAAIFQGEPSIQQADVNATGYDPTDYQTAVKNWIAATGSNADLNAVKKDPIQFAIKEGFLPPAPPRTVNDMMDQVVLDQLRQNGLMAPALETSLNAKLEAAYQADLTGKTAAQANPADDPNSYQLDEATGIYVPKQSVLDAVNAQNATSTGAAPGEERTLNTPWGPVSTTQGPKDPGMARLITAMATGVQHPDDLTDNTVMAMAKEALANYSRTGTLSIDVSGPQGIWPNAPLPARFAQYATDNHIPWNILHFQPDDGNTGAGATAPGTPGTPVTLPASMTTQQFRDKFENQSTNPLPPIPSTQMFNQTFNAADRAGVGQLFQGMGIDPSILSDQINKLAPPSGTSSLATPLFTSKGLAGVYG